MGTLQLAVFHGLTAMLLLCYVRSIIVGPGGIPENDLQWDYAKPETSDEQVPGFVMETKRSGQRRHCKWCGKYKPDRCHHCRVCQKCVLRMDHHCPWIYNCVGFFNYKYFFLLIFYSVLVLQLMAWTMPETVMRCIEMRASFVTMFTMLFAETVVAVLGILVTLFFGFHVWLMLQGMSTIEFCEKSMPKHPGDDGRLFDGSPFSLGVAGNFCAVLGDRPLLWLVPFGFPPGNGLYFAGGSPVQPMKFADDLEATKVFARGKKSAASRRFGPWAFCAASGEEGL